VIYAPEFHTLHGRRLLCARIIERRFLAGTGEDTRPAMHHAISQDAVRSHAFSAKTLLYAPQHVASGHIPRTNRCIASSL
jgi:hypothetical protein